MKYVTLIVVLLISGAHTIAQKKSTLDSLIKVIKNNPNSEAFFEAAMIYRHAGKSDSAFVFFQKSLALSQNKSLEAKVRRELADLALASGFTVLAQDIAFKALNLSMDLGDSIQISKCYHLLGRIADDADLFDRASDYYTKSIDFDPVGIASKNNLGLLCLLNGQNYKAIGIFQDILKAAKDTLMMAIAHNNIGSAFLNIKSYDSAFKHITQTLRFSKLSSDSIGLMFDCQLMGRYYFAKKSYENAKRYYLLSLALNEKFGAPADWTKVELPLLYQNLSTIYELEHKTDSVLWIKNEMIKTLELRLKRQKKNSAEFSFSSQDEIMQILDKQQQRTKQKMVQYYGLALLILFCIVTYLLLSGKDIQRRNSNYISVVLLILLFEFILILIDPLKASITNEQPVFEFGFNVALALLIVPIQIYGEKMLRKFAIEIKLKRVDS